MCNLSAIQVLASAIKKAGESRMISVSQLIRYNNLILEKIEDYYNTIDMSDLSFEVSSIAYEFEITISESYERVIRLHKDKSFDYSIYENTMPDDIARQIDEIELPL